MAESRSKVRTLRHLSSSTEDWYQNNQRLCASIHMDQHFTSSTLDGPAFEKLAVYTSLFYEPLRREKLKANRNTPRILYICNQ